MAQFDTNDLHSGFPANNSIVCIRFHIKKERRSFNNCFLSTTHTNSCRILLRKAYISAANISDVKQETSLNYTFGIYEMEGDLLEGGNLAVHKHLSESNSPI